MNANLNRRMNSIWQQRSSGKNSSRRGRHSRLQDNGGFTLVELIVVLIVLGILATLAVMGLRGWQDYADFKQNNEFAKSIFQASQIQLTQYGERGQLSELIAAVTNDGKASRAEYMLSEQGSLRGSDGKPLDVAAEGDGTIWENGFTGNIYFLMAEKGDYNLYVNELKGMPAAESRALPARSRRIKALYDMIDPYISDKEMLNAAICIEFDPDPKVALVYSVFYNHKAERFTYEDTGSSELKEGTAPIQNRSRDARREAKTGYYGADTMAKGTDTYISRPVISNVRLNNEETLNLSWTTKGDSGRALTRLIYSIDLYAEDSASGKDGTYLMTIILGKTNEETISVSDGTVKASVLRAKSDEAEEYVFPIRIQPADNAITLVLDGLDLNADETTDAQALAETASIHRLGMKADIIHAVITGSRTGVYDITIKKQSNSEHQYFGGMTVREDGTAAYTIENARHLSNIRYKEAGYGTEDSTAAANHTYQISRDISWEYILNKGAVYQNAEQIIPVNGDITPYFFTPILTLRDTSVLESDNGEQGRSLIKFRFDAAHTSAANTSLGLVADNKGMIRNLSMKGVYVNGAASTEGGGAVYAAAAGAFCGINNGTLDNLTTEDNSDGTPSRISGLQYIGGIAGRSGIAPAGGNFQSYTNLTNRANVTGQRYVGGITGSLETSGGKITVAGCRNYGKVRGTIVENGAAGSEKEAWFFGGIVGYTGAAGTSAGTAAGLITLADCQSSPYYTNAEIDELIEKIKAPDSTELVENFVGGIAGYNDIAQIINCSTEQEQAGRSGYVVGKDYVGGIVGYNSSLVSLEGGSSNRNQVHVIGHSFVGGIAGCNAVGELKGDADSGYYLVLANRTGSGAVTERARLKGWINEGLITSIGDYAGGITGYNSATGVIEDSYSNVEYDGSAEALAQVSSQARFAGGVAGYNKGQIVSTAGTTTTVSVVSGKDYVGGVVGCNDAGGEIIRYELEGGYVGGSHFVGGFIGLNMEPGIFSYHIKSNPNKVSGDYFVGGVIGGNLVPIDETTETLHVSFETDNFLGDLLAEQGAFAGGFIGYNYLLKSEAAEQVITDADNMQVSRVLVAADQLCGDETLAALKGSDEQIDGGEALETVLEKFLSSDASAGERYVNKTTHMVITGQGNTASHQTLGSVRGRVFVGGVVGYNQPTTWLEIRNVENITPVEATGYIEMVEAGMTKLHRYSYAGGMIGKVGERVTLNNCSNRDSGEVRAKGTYTGGLAEINYGTIKNCTAGNIGDGTANYVGGIVGVNADSTRGAGSAGGDTIVSGRGLLTDCSIGGQVSGMSYVGGLAAENYGIIRYTEGNSAGDSGTEAVVDASGRYAGGVVGYAHDGGQIIIDGNVTLNINVIGTAQYVGGIAGVNAGIIKVAEESKNYIIENTDENIIIGRNYVGGFIGMQLEPSDENSKSNVTLRRFENHAQVQSAYGYAGGIVALIQKSAGSNTDEKAPANDRNERVILERCKNFGTVEVLSGEETDDEEVIFPDDGSMDEESPDTADGYIPDTDDDGVPAAGGITAVNYGIIRLCGNYGSVAANSGYMGGIAAINYHQIERSETAAKEETVQPRETVEALELTGDLYVGGIAAINKDGAEINRSVVRSVILHNQSGSESGHIGGIAALNDGLEGKGGIIKDCIVGVDVDLDVLSSQNNTDYSGLRAEAARSVEMSMSHDTFRRGDSEVLGNTVLLVSYAADVNMGGIAGRNEGSVTGVARSFGGSDYYSVVAADLRFDSDSMNYFGNIGGITGVNGGTVEKYEFSGYVRGSAGDPANTPEYSAAYDLERNKSRIYGYGGIVGSNGSDLLTSNTARIERCYIGMAKIQGTGDGSNRTNVGGIAGFNGTGATIKKIAFSQMTGADAVGVNKFFLQTVDTRYAKRDPKTNNRNDWDPPLSVITKGTVWVNVTNYGHLGGVAGYNRGNISEINWTSDYAGKREIEGSTEEGYFPNGIYDHEKKYENRPVDVDYTGVLVTSGAGLVGGITGYNHRTGAVSQAVTGKNWLVSATSQQLGNGIGGIIGYNISEQDIVSCDNHATVYKISDDAVGGITGCQENGTSSSWRYYDCKNYGVLYAKNRGGGVIGVWKYKGGTIEQCQNYGRIHSLNSCGGGIVALVESVSGGETINLTRCENFGEVYTNNDKVSLSGILSYVDDSQASLDIQISECVNTGNMIGNYEGLFLNGRGGIFGITQGNSEVYIRYCRNYGFIREDSRFYGITQGNGKTTLEYCIGAANSNKVMDGGAGTWGIQYPLAEDAKNVINSYYFVDPYHTKLGGVGKRLKIEEDNKAKVFANNEVIVPDMGGYKTGEVVVLNSTGRIRRNSDESYRLCKGTDSKTGLDKYLEVVGNSNRNLATPVLKTPELAANGEYMVSWDAIDGARYYVVSCEYLNEKGESMGLKNSEVYTNSVLVSSSYEADGIYASGVRVRIQACSGDKLSGMSDAKEIVFGFRLPYPQISWKLAAFSEKGYRVVLDNREEYVEFVKENMLGGMDETDPDYQKMLQAEMENINIHTTGINVPFSAWAGGYKKNGSYVLLASPTGMGLDNKTVTSYADYTGNIGGIGQSVQIIRESQFPHKTDYEQTGSPLKNSEKFADVQIAQSVTSTDIGFAGRTADELSYYMKLINNEADTTWAVYYRSEMMANDPELGVPVAVSVAEQTPIPSTKSEEIGVKLGNFPGDFLDKDKTGIKYQYQNVWVRTYPTAMANSIVQQGWKVTEQEYTADEMENLRVSTTGELAETGHKLIRKPISGSKFVLPGYVIVWTGKNSQDENIYSLYYNTLLTAAFGNNGMAIDKNCIYDTETYMKYQVFYHPIDLTTAINKVQPTPAAYLNAAYDETVKAWKHGDKYDESDKFVLTWDQAASNGKSAYTGAEPEENYKNATYRLTLTGLTADGKTTILENEKEISTPDRNAVGCNTYTADSKNWDYVNIHAKLTRVGEVNTSGITLKFPSAVELDFPMRRRLSQVKDVKISLKRNDQGVVIKDALQYDISFNGITDQAETNALSVYRIEARSLDNPAKVMLLDVAMDNVQIGTDGRQSAALDLSSFRKERISITVQAVAKENDTTYRNGLSSPVREMTVPERLLPPQMGMPDGSDKNNMTAVNYTEEQVMSVDDFVTSALTLNMKKDGQSAGTSQVNYQIALELYETAKDAKEGTNPIEASDAGLPERSDANKVTMTYSTVAGEYTYTIQNLPITYAGKWVRVVLRSLGASSISSVWTDETDPGYEGFDGEIPEVEPCMVFKLPSVQVDAVKFRELDDSEAWEDGVYTVYEDGVEVKDDVNGKTMTVNAAQRWVWFDMVDYADDYQIVMVQTPQQADKKALITDDKPFWQVSDVNWITLEKGSDDAADQTYSLTYQTTEGADAGALKKETRTISVDGAEITIPYLENIRILSDRTYYIQSEAKVRLETNADTKAVSVGILLPDCRVDNESQPILYQRTEQILVQSLAGVQDGSAMGAYRDSKWALVSWKDEELVQSTEPIEQAKEPITPKSVSSTAVEEKTISDVLYTLALEGDTRYLVKVTEGGKELGIFGVPRYSEVTIGQSSQSVWFPMGFKDCAGKAVGLEFLSIFNVSSGGKGGISQEYTNRYTASLPELTAQADEPVVTSRMAEPMQYRIDITENAGLRKRLRSSVSNTCVLTAAQKTLVWDYDLSDVTVAGYELAVGGSQMEADFRESIDLHRGLFGAMPGIREYLEPGGKLLYTVNYHVDGELVLDLNQEYPLASESNAVTVPESDVSTATASNSDRATASNSNMATASNSTGEPNVLILECRLRAEYLPEEGETGVLRFTLTLPDLSFDWMQEEAVALYQEAFEEGLYQTETFRLTPVMTDRCYKASEVLLDLAEMRGELQE